MISPPDRLARRLQSQTWMKTRTRSFFLFAALPAWLLPGLLDWWCHRRTRIQEPENGGVAESLVHSAMLAEGGLPLLLSAAFEMNPLNIALMTSSAVLHELTAIADVRLALNSERRVSQLEQHIHSFLEVMPFWVVPLMVLLHEPATSGWRLVRRDSSLSRRDLAIVAAAVAVVGVLPYAEELLRSLRQRQSEGLESPDGNGSNRFPSADGTSPVTPDSPLPVT